MPVTTYDKCRTRRQSALNVDVILWVGQERPEPKPWGNETSLAENGIRHSVNLVPAQPRFITKYTGLFQDILVFQGHGRRHGKGNIANKHFPQ
ncbi:hypothetical protein EV132_13253 [Rhizobium sullae]|uniref:Uncharacterized protein n=1 Tax=Rhizobium sullae TaxID=50338 RepID=A0A4R3PRH0_RHISU|nr:hypothetical protein EV132_13253 [Rhizobium sullae]